MSSKLNWKIKPVDCIDVCTILNGLTTNARSPHTKVEELVNATLHTAEKRKKKTTTTTAAAIATTTTQPNTSIYFTKWDRV